jgi:17beta-estradiol 17-dehydrogenase / very-long-chain 3-oxoacyl-CoA reductase
MTFYSVSGFVLFWVFLIWLAAKISKGVWTSWLSHALGKNYQWKVKPNSWAVITGSTDGIGLEYAKEFAAKGFNLFLIARNESKLMDVKSLIEREVKQCKEIKTLVVDFSKPTGIYERIQKEVESLPDIHVLVNSVGISYCTPEFYTQLEVTNSPSFVDDIINVNVVSVAKVVKAVLPKMEKQKRGVIINISSISASYPTPLLSIYAATKIFVDLFSRSLHAEYQSKGIIVQSVLPSYVATKMSKIKKATFMVPTAKDYVKGAMKTIGVETRTYGYWTHKLQGFVQDNVINGLFGPDPIVTLARSQLLKINKSYYKKFINNKKE